MILFHMVCLLFWNCMKNLIIPKELQRWLEAFKLIQIFRFKKELANIQNYYKVHGIMIERKKYVYLFLLLNLLFKHSKVFLLDKLISILIQELWKCQALVMLIMMNILLRLCHNQIETISDALSLQKKLFLFQSYRKNLLSNSLNQLR